MKHYTLKTYDIQSVIFSGLYSNFVECLEDAVRQGVDLGKIDLRHKNLSNANLDTAYMPGADFTQCNLAGANLSECSLRGSTFHNAALYNTCFCYSDLRYCDFRSASFGGTDINGSDISYSTFSALSCFELDFWHTEKMEGCHYIGLNGKMSAMAKRPVVVKGLMNVPVVVLDEDMHVGQASFPKDHLPKLLAFIEMHAMNRLARR